MTPLLSSGEKRVADARAAIGRIYALPITSNLEEGLRADAYRTSLLSLNKNNKRAIIP